MSVCRGYCISFKLLACAGRPWRGYAIICWVVVSELLFVVICRLLQLHAGVPQGAVLSPLLFSLYMNDIVQCTKAAVNLFADDTSIYVTDKSSSGLQTKLQLVLDQLATWFGSWALTVNPRKSALMVFTTRRSVPAVKCVLVW